MWCHSYRRNLLSTPNEQLTQLGRKNAENEWDQQVNQNHRIIESRKDPRGGLSPNPTLKAWLRGQIRLLWALSSWDLKSSKDVDWVFSHSNARLSMERAKISSLPPVRTFLVLIFVHKLITYFTCFLRKIPTSCLWVIFTNQMGTSVWLDKWRHFYVLFTAQTYWQSCISPIGWHYTEGLKIQYAENKQLPLRIFRIHLKNSISIVLLK